jgi:steroid delta-isomerase-like uncharacterized protein
MARRQATAGERLDPLAGHNEAFAARDPDALAATFAADGILDIKPFGDPAAGTEQIAARFRELFAAFPDLRTQRIRRFVRPGEAIEELKLSATHRAPIFGVPGTGKTISVRARHVLAISQGRINRLDAYWDTPTLLMQIGAPQSNRFADAGAVAASLLAEDPAAHPVDDVAFQAAPVPPPPPRHRKHRGRRLVPLAVALALVVAGGTAMAIATRHHSPRPQTQAQTRNSPSAAPPSSTTSPSAPPSEAPVPQWVLTAGGLPLLGMPRVEAVRLSGKTVLAKNVPVVAVAPHDGVWIGSTSRPVWLELADEVPYNPVLRFKVGQRLTFLGVLAANNTVFVADSRIDGYSGYQVAVRMGYHIDANYKQIAVS